MAFRIAVDAMGGDHAPEVVVEGALDAAALSGEEITVILVGQEESIREFLPESEDQSLPAGIEIVHAEEVIEMAEAPATALKTKPNSSIHVGLGLLAKGEADAFLSAGNTGAVMAASVFVPGRIKGVSRPSIASYYPTSSSFCIVLDVGANVECKPEHLVQFARMGKVFMERVHQRENPTVALMNIGEEASKGNELVKEAYKLLETDGTLNFVGNIEGRDLMAHGADLVICDGFVGNIMLKLGESVATILVEMLKSEMEGMKLTWDERATVAKVVGTVKKRFDYEEFGGAPLLGIKGNVMIGHGGSTAKAIERLILAGAEMAKQTVASSIAEAFSSEVSPAEGDSPGFE
jgi:glycerol-3-phosphate acyltransferase PlsX